MTSPTQLDCPDPENYAAVALQLQETALQAEQRLYAVERTLRAAANRPTIVQTTTAALTGLASGSFVDIQPGLVATTTNFNNMPFGWSYSTIGVLPGAGMYDIGCCLNLIASGAVTDNSFRIIRIRQLRPVTSGGIIQTQVDLAEWVIFEANVGGGMDVTVTGTFHLQPGDEIDFQLWHANTGSTMNVSSGAIYWTTFLGSEAAVETF